MSDLLKILFPPRCPACRKVMEADGTYIHEECRHKFRQITEPRCFKCGRSLKNEEEALCPECRQKKHSYSYGFCLYEYNETARTAMIDFKSNGIRRNGDFFIKGIIDELGPRIKRMNPEALVPVPVTGKRKSERGFNQSEYLAKGIGEVLGICVDSDILYRVGISKEQKKLSGRERSAISLTGFEAVEDMQYKRICLVDDVYTTGSTLEGCTRALQKSGAEEVGFVTVFSGDMF